MHSRDVREWIAAHQRAQTQPQVEKEPLEQHRLGLIIPDETDLDSDSGFDGRWHRERAEWEGSSRSRALDTATRLALLVGTVMIATLAIFFG